MSERPQYRPRRPRRPLPPPIPVAKFDAQPAPRQAKPRRLGMKLRGVMIALGIVLIVSATITGVVFVSNQVRKAVGARPITFDPPTPARVKVRSPSDLLGQWKTSDFVFNGSQRTSFPVKSVAISEFGYWHLTRPNDAKALFMSSYRVEHFNDGTVDLIPVTTTDALGFSGAIASPDRDAFTLTVTHAFSPDSRDTQLPWSMTMAFTRID